MGLRGKDQTRLFTGSFGENEVVEEGGVGEGMALFWRRKEDGGSEERQGR